MAHRHRVRHDARISTLICIECGERCDNQARRWVAYLAGETFPKRKLHELNDLYVGKKEAARILGVNRNSVIVLKGCPEPKYRAGRTLWLKSDIEAWRDQRVREDVGRGRWKRKKT